MWVILYCKGEDEVLKTVCFNGRYDQAEDYIEDESNMPEGTTRALIIPEKNYIFDRDEWLRRENEAFERVFGKSCYAEKTGHLNGHLKSGFFCRFILFFKKYFQHGFTKIN